MFEGIAEAIISAETSPIRFEKLCRGLCERSENLTILPTSVNYDQARDGRSLASGRAGLRVALCVTLGQELDEKIRSDIEKLSRTTLTERLIYCCSQRLTERRIDALTETIRSYLPKSSIQVLSAIQLAALCERYQDVLKSLYQAELGLITSRLIDFRKGGETTENKGLRLALFAFGTDDAVALRRAVSARAVLEVLATSSDSFTAKEIATKLSTDLRLPRVLDFQYIRSTLEYLVQNRDAAESDGAWRITRKGRNEAHSVPPDAARELLNGRAVIRTAVEELLGMNLGDDQFERIWVVLLDFLSDLFYSNGLAVIAAINDFMASRDAGSGDAKSLERIIEEGAARIRAQSSLRELGEDIEQAIRDVFTERSGPAFRWLTRACERFIVLCALGLEVSSATEVRATLARYCPVLDSDVVITILCAGESQYESTREILSRFRELGGRVLVAPPVLEEVAYHAFISEHDFRATLGLNKKLKREERRRYIENAFVRGFYALTGDARKWDFYRSQFVGKSARDYTRILAILRDELMVQVLPARYDGDLAEQMAEYLQRIAEEVGKPELVYYRDVGKAGRDGQILASIAAARTANREVGSDAAVVLLSSSSRLRRADRKFRDALGLPESVITVRALAYMMALIPDVGLGADTLRQALFDFGETAHLTDVQRLALRAIKKVGVYDVPWAKRRRFEEELEKVIRRDAEKLGMPPEKVRQRFFAGDRTVRPGEMIVETLKEMAAADKREGELAAAKEKIGRLEARVEELNQELAGKRS